MDKTYNPEDIEQRWYQRWEENNHFAPDSDNDGDPYCIVIPPPNVTGYLHMGHAFQDTIMDLLIRYQRMRGSSTLWQVGTDHAGIATQMVVERQLATKGISRHDLGREKFIENVWDWKAESGGQITQQLRRMGASADWSRERFTMDDGLSSAVREVFISLYDKGLIYRGKRLVNWDPVLHTAISDLEVDSVEEQGFLWHIRYPLADGSGSLTVATTRPETLLGDTAVAVHPDDSRYQHLIGKLVTLPMTGREIPIIADDYVDPEFGSGCVKITPAHDFNDYQMGQRHQLPMINVLTGDAAISDNMPEAYRGMDRFDARKKLVADLKAADLLEKIDDHKLMVPRGDRSGAVIEPWLTDQWYVKVAPLAKPAIAAVENGDIRFVPENWSRTYFEWMNNLEDWCISRQIWWGHRIPVWYDQEGKHYAGQDEADVRQRHQLPAHMLLTQDEDVLDTWFSSALWPFSTLGWPEQTPELEKFYPTSVLVTGFDIIFFWVARMIMMGLEFTGEVPFREIYIHGLVRDADGQKMSKSKGNVLDPIDLIDGADLDTLIAKRTAGLMQPDMKARIEKSTRKQFPNGIPAFGTDALRFTFASQATLGRDIRFDLQRIEGYRNFCTKLWNAARYVMMNIGDDPDSAAEQVNELPTGSTQQLSAADRWIRSRFGETLLQIETAITDYRFDYVANELYQFAWDNYCDWYIELTKPVLNGDDAAARSAARQTLVEVLEAFLRAAHPVMPFITEEIWQRIKTPAGVTGDTLMVQSWPTHESFPRDQPAEAEIEWLQNVVSAVRTIRGEMNIAPRKPLPLLLQNGTDQDRLYLDKNLPLLKTVAVVDNVEWVGSEQTAPDSAIGLVGTLQLLVPLADLIDPAAELARLEKEIAKLQKVATGSEQKLANESFTSRAPAEVVAKEQQKLAELRDQLGELEQQRERIARLASAS
ncbi:MAG: valine--tRNA ligase [Gammaproteobacteria bacterium]|nr:MAG: valine--tRNA ligase [Gammaproteobacteria bacterium]